MPYIDQANIACGGHAGDCSSMALAVKQALEHDVAIAAHPSYPDREHFGRRSMAISVEALSRALRKQVADIDKICKHHNTSLTHIKAHGALYNDCFVKPELTMLMMGLAQDYHCALLLQATTTPQAWLTLAIDYGVNIEWEGFADRAYTDSGALVSREHEHAVHKDVASIIEQAQTFNERGGVVSETQRWLALPIDSLCVHSDTQHALDAVKQIHHVFHRTD